MKWSKGNDAYLHLSIYARVMSLWVILFMILILQGCGNDTNDADSSNAKYNCTISVSYEKSKMSYNDSVNIIIDDEVIGSISPGKDTTLDVELASGTHKVWVKATSLWHKRRKSNKISISVDSNSSYVFNLKDESIAGLKIHTQE